jgi:hypothetical protein
MQNLERMRIASEGLGLLPEYCAEAKLEDRVTTERRLEDFLDSAFVPL